MSAAGAQVGERRHRHRAAVLAALTGFGAPMSALALHAELRARGENVGISTLYRELRALAESNGISEAHVGAQAIYWVSGRDLLVCDACGRIEETAAAAGNIDAAARFFSETVPLTIHGRCRACAG